MSLRAIWVDLGIQERTRVATHDVTACVRTDNLLDRYIIGSVIVNDANCRFLEPEPGRRWLAGAQTTLGR